MKKITLLFLLLTGAINAQDVTIPDPNLKLALISASPANEIAKDINGNFMAIDTNDDNQIQLAEAQAVYALDLRTFVTGGLEIADATGINAFANLRDLNLYGHISITSLDLTALTNLEKLNVDFLQITSLDLSGYAQLKVLSCMSMPLVSLDITGCNALEELWALETGLPSLIIPNMPNLRIVYIGSMDLSMDTIDVSGCTSLELIDFAHWRQKHINVSGCTALQNLFIIDGLPLDINGTEWETLDASNSGLTYFGAQGNTALHTLNLSGCTALTNVVIFENNLNDVNVTGCSALTNLNLIGNPLQQLDLSGCTSLEKLYAYGNQLNTLDVSDCTALEELIVWDGQLTSIDLTGLVNLYDIAISDNQLTSLDVSMLPNLTSLGCENNQLTYLNLKNGSIESNLSFGNNPILQFICVDEDQWASVQEDAMPSTVVSPYCTFTPGGDYNTITGNLRLDYDGDGCATTIENRPYMRVNINDGANTSAVFTDASGVYTAHRLAGNFTITPVLENPIAFNVNPVSATASFATVDNSTATLDFCLTYNPYTDLEVIVTSAGLPRTNANIAYQVVYRNKGSQTMSGTLLFQFDDAVMDYVNASSTPTAINTGELSFAFSNFAPLQTGIINIYLHTNGATSTPPLEAGDELNLTASVPVTDGELTPSDNAFTLSQTVVNSFDPNDKTCLEGETLSPQKIGEYLHYNINFENIGTADAINVVVRDTINTAQFDIDSLQLLYASHPVYTRINGNIVEFIFENINLPPSTISPIGGHGNVLFKIKTLPTLQTGDVASNTANIYFDYNHPIETNEARTTFELLKRQEFVTDDSVTVYPNPARNMISIKADSAIRTIEMFDVQGRILQHTSENKNATNLDVSARANGIYFLRITTAKGSLVRKLVKE